MNLKKSNEIKKANSNEKSEKRKSEKSSHEGSPL